MSDAKVNIRYSPLITGKKLKRQKDRQAELETRMYIHTDRKQTQRKKQRNR